MPLKIRFLAIFHFSSQQIVLWAISGFTYPTSVLGIAMWFYYIIGDATPRKKLGEGLPEIAGHPTLHRPEKS
jgi:hypothetical protein